MVRVIRLEKQIFKNNIQAKGILGQVEQIYNNGFHVKSRNSDLLFFQGGEQLQSPFSIILDVNMNGWINDVFLLEGNILYVNNNEIYSLDNRNIKLSIHEPKVIDLKKTKTFKSPTRSQIIYWVQELVTRLLLKGRFEGILTILWVLKDYWPELKYDGLRKTNLWSHHAMPGIIALLKSTTIRDFALFKSACYALIGLGPGLTPSCDDFLVGFLSVHYKLKSPIKDWIYQSGVIDEILDSSLAKTTSVSYQFLKYASKGLFSETLINVIDSVITTNCSNKKGRHSKIDDFLCWGHTSGSDTMVGIVMGLYTLSVDRY